MRPYLRVLGKPDFRRLWTGATVSTLGDGMTFVALSWLVLARPGGTAQLGVLGICYTAPVLLGGLAVALCSTQPLSPWPPSPPSPLSISSSVMQRGRQPAASSPKS
jgi:hypothetical protein